ncbi:UDP-N-acetylmuramoyl-L-alanyl-D-glutamate--2,6-diaminopimelate ligase [Bombilactobacillus thymidiniphilus]|uniref:UDP-N-acetylmuramyl-tripeptide synthetase n=1 Tax=Bombilactobacillus thymidiniphilus TaxID=2923363 RepID=A0ABY4PEX2_9LACO|nr:UDP-N-acetylmuramoyl-L-alanyl-D-glutamate--2,6-diaminopimelate ligase [Bombilactobacillus thymidiniphilus]UQS84218.1 UDP-N-acetylmuramoyl-L-alanyl-D-glutamate--2,6-diaminopimelate ligase [Bombilactobacillus thymidiniphilus]
MTLILNGCILLLKEHQLLKQADIVFDNEITAVTYDSRTVQKDGMFFCKGTNFKEEYLVQAQKNGATTYVSEIAYPNIKGMNALIVNDVQKAMALLGAAFYDYPQNKLFVIAFTGTKGKTTSAYFTRGILQNYSNKKTALFSTIDRIVGPKPEQRFKSDLTTPESLDLFRDMRTAVDNGMTHLVMEVSSQAYKRNRVYGLHYDVGFFLNISPDHIGPNEHPDFADYLHCKLQLLVNSKYCVINADTACFEEVYQAAKATTAADNIYLFAKKGKNTDNVDFVYSSQEATLADSEFSIIAQTVKAQALNVAGLYQLSLIGDFNESNATAAVIGAGLAGAPYELAKTSLANVRIPGRMETLKTQDHGTIYVDYAHNYASMQALLSFLKKNNPDKKIIVVVGSPGNKGVSRRADFAKVLSEYADFAYLTTDDPGFEDPAAICAEIDERIDHQKVAVQTILDRFQAIAVAIKQSNPDDLVILAGKGRDNYQKVAGEDQPYPDDFNVAKQIVLDLED